jgi:hypothetical protein
MYKVLVRDLPPRPLTVETQEEFLHHAKSKRAIVQKAYDDLNSDGWKPQYEKLADPFVKFEKAQIDSEKPPWSKPPRMIQPRPPPYTYQVARWLHPFENYVFRTRFGKRSKRPWFTKGMDSWRIAERIVNMEGDVYVCLDHSAFDASLRAELRNMVEFAFYMDFYRGDEELASLLKVQLRNRGRTKNGVKYYVYGTMMSGEYNTALGDSILNYAALRLCFGERADIIINGDDSVVRVGYTDLRHADFDIFKRIGWKTKIQYAYREEEVEYCQCRPVFMGQRWRMVRTPSRFVSRIAATCKQLSGKAWKELAWAVGAGELSCNQGVPILQSIATAIIRDNPERSLKWLNRYMKENRRDEKIDINPVPVAWETRVSFDLAFNISPADQLAAERCVEAGVWRTLLS